MQQVGMLMSIQKNTPNFLKHSGLTFTTTINNTMDLIHDDGALGIYCYLASKPENWVIREKDLQNRFTKGRDYIKNKVSLLKKIGLIKVEAIRDNKGIILRWETTLLNQILLHNTENPYCGEESNKNGASTSIEYKVIHRNYNNYIHNTENPQSGSATLWETRTHSNKRDLSSKAFKDYKNKSSYDQKWENEKKPAWADSKDQMANETKHIEAHEESKKAEINAYQPNGVGQRTLEKILKELGGYHPKIPIKQ